MKKKEDKEEEEKSESKLAKWRERMRKWMRRKENKEDSNKHDEYLLNGKEKTWVKYFVSIYLPSQKQPSHLSLPPPLPPGPLVYPCHLCLQPMVLVRLASPQSKAEGRRVARKTSMVWCCSDPPTAFSPSPALYHIITNNQSLPLSPVHSRITSAIRVQPPNTYHTNLYLLHPPPSSTPSAANAYPHRSNNLNPTQT